MAQHYVQAKDAGEAIENLVNVGVWTLDELERRHLPVPDSAWLDAPQAIRESSPPTVLKARLAHLPSRIPVVESFVSLAGSALNKAEPPDLDIVIRANQ